MHAADSARPPAHTVVVLGLLTMFGPLSLDLYLPALPQLADDLNASTSAAQLSITTCLVGLAVGQLVAGPLSDRLGRKPPLTSDCRLISWLPWLVRWRPPRASSPYSGSSKG
jgi:MFS family permease